MQLAAARTGLAGLQPAMAVAYLDRSLRMDALTRPCRCTLLCAALFTTGCTLLNPPPAARKEDPAGKSDEPPLITARPAENGASQAADYDPKSDEVAQKVLDYVANVENAASRKTRTPTPAAAPDGAIAGPPGPQRAAPPVGFDSDAARGADTFAVPHPADKASARAGRNSPAITVQRDPHATARHAGEESVAADSPSGSPADAHTNATAETNAAADGASSRSAPATGAPPLAAPPVLLDVNSRPAAKRDDPAGGKSTPSPAPAVNAPAEASAAPVELKEMLRKLAQSGDNSPFAEQLDARVLAVVAGDYERARAPLNMVSTEQQEMATRYIEALVAIREAHLGDPAGGASGALKPIEELAESLRKFGDLSVPTLAICREVRGFGQYTAIDPPQFPAGVASEFVAYCELRDFTSEKRPDGYFVTRFDLRTSLLTSAGETVVELRDDNIEDRCRNRRRDCFIPRLVRLPATLSPGEYVVKISVTDRLGQKVAERSAALRVVAR